MEKSKTERLKELFEEWKIAQSKEDDETFKKTKGDTQNVTKTTFCEDGIINEEIFENQKENPVKVLFISNEPNCDSEDGGSRIIAFQEYYRDKIDNWGGKLREKTCALYKAIIKNYEVPEWKVACNFAFMNINKRGGNRTIADRNKDKNHIEEYCKQYRKFIKGEIDIINPDIIVWMSITTYNMDLPKQYLGAKEDNHGLLYIDNIPILNIKHPGYAHTLSKDIQPNKNFKNNTLGKLATKIEEEMKRYNIF